MKWSHSRVSAYQQCPYKFKLKYLEELETIPNWDDANNPLIIGTALHHALEKGIDAAIDEYYMSYPVINDLHVNEAIKIEYLAKQLQLPPGRFEVPINTDTFTGFIDYLTDDGDIYDFKYSNNQENYLDSSQTHLYKYYYQLSTGKKIRNLYYVFFPKTFIRQKKQESLYEFRNRIETDLSNKLIKKIQVTYDEQKVKEFIWATEYIAKRKTFDKNQSKLCDWCEYKEFCESERSIDYMILPKNERLQNEVIQKKKIYLYGAPFSGKTYLANQFPDVLLLSTDGNYTHLPGGIPPHIDIKNEVKMDGRLKRTKLAWTVFKDVIDELEKKENTFRSLVLDLVEDIYEACRLFMYDQMGITHESDDSFRAWDKVRTEFLSTMKRFVNLDYENIILISHEDTSKDLTKRTGDKITTIRPNMNEKVANKLAGMVDIVIRVAVIDGQRLLMFKNDEVVFGGGRLTFNETEIPNDYNELMRVYETSNELISAVEPVKKPIKKAEEVKPAGRRSRTKTVEEEEEEITDNVDETLEDDTRYEEYLYQTEPAVTRRTRTRTKTVEQPQLDIVEEVVKPTRKSRTRTVEVTPDEKGLTPIAEVLDDITPKRQRKKRG
ncbi:MAG: AAA family ATPase [Erysipelotrichia bacterium]|nr:AAA family ATPase [Erysipelotrichia bacterium]